jgi:uncharacterized protein YecE (DUF72 family)
MQTMDTQKIFVSMGGWEFGPFNKLFYPSKIRASSGAHKLEYYSRFFDSVEVNATFYNAALTADHSRRWLQDVSANKNFMFTVKLFHGFTHTFAATNDDVRSVRNLVEPIAAAEKLGGLLLQFPYSFTNTFEHRKYLLQFSKVFYPHCLFVEVRHKSWNTPAFYNLLQERNLHLVNVDLPRIRQHIPFTNEVWGGAAYYRLMGRSGAGWSDGERGNYCYTPQELSSIAARVKSAMSKQPLPASAFVVFHNFAEYALNNGLQLRSFVERRMPDAQTIVRSTPEFKRIVVPTLSLPLFTQV